MIKHPGAEHLELAIRIRAFEERLLELFRCGHLSGTVHTCIGQEWTGVAAAAAFRPGDLIVSNHRGHGHFLALTSDVRGLMLEIMGREGGVCGGIGGSQHLVAPGFMSNGIQGGMLPIAAGHALHGKRKRTSAVAIAFIGDGTLGEGAVYETLNIASRLRLPLVVVVENNGIAQTTPAALTLAGSIESRAAAFGIAYRRGDGNDPQQLLDVFAAAVGAARADQGPVVIEALVDRLMAHSKGDDTRTTAEIATLRARNWFTALDGPGGALAGLKAQADAEMLALAQECLRQPAATAIPAALARPRAAARPPARPEADRINARIHAGLGALMERERDAVLIGEDVLSPYGGAFKVARDLSDRFPDRVVTTPISEAAIVGLATGIALAGGLGIAEIMFGDFSALALDQVLNHAAKFRFMFAGKVAVPMVLRTPMGGRRGYGPTHSQSLERFLTGIPGLRAVALNHRVDPAWIYGEVIPGLGDPVVVFENKVLYTRLLACDPPKGFAAAWSDDLFPAVTISPVGVAPLATIVTYGEMAGEAELALEELFDAHELAVELVILTGLSPLELAPVLASVARTGTVLCVEEGVGDLGVGAEVYARLAEHGGRLRFLPRLCATGMIPSSASLEKTVLPDRRAIVSRVQEGLAR